MSEKPCGAYFFAFFENFFVPILTSGGYVGLSIATLLSQHHKVTAADIIPEKVELIEPFAMQDAIPFQTAYLAGYVADKYDVNAEESIERANKRIRRSTEETFQQTVTGYDSVKVENSSIQLHGGKAKYALFPVWLLSTSWRGENYLFAMNGQTGRFVGDLPVDKGAARKWMLGLTAALSAASYGVMWLLWLARIL